MQKIGAHIFQAEPPLLIDSRPVVACWVDNDEEVLCSNVAR